MSSALEAESFAFWPLPEADLVLPVVVSETMLPLESLTMIVTDPSAL